MIKINIGIDPDVNKSGWAESVAGALTAVGNKSLFEVFKFLENNRDVVVYISAGWLINNTTWHVGQYVKIKGGYRPLTEKQIRKTASDVGRNHEIGKQIVKVCELLQIEHYLTRPTGKVNGDLFKKITGWEKQTNQDSRDAAMLVFDRK